MSVTAGSDAAKLDHRCCADARRCQSHVFDPRDRRCIGTGRCGSGALGLASPSGDGRCGRHILDPRGFMTCGTGASRVCSMVRSELRSSSGDDSRMECMLKPNLNTSWLLFGQAMSTSSSVMVESAQPPT